MASTPTFEVLTVGGAVRDEMLGRPVKDVDFVVVGPKTLDELVAFMEADGFKVFKVDAQTLTVRAKVPASMPELLAQTDVADFVLARKESSESNGRRPDLVEVGTLETDLARRDFTVNAMARRTDGTLVDMFGGQADCETMTLRFVGDPMLRLREDALRLLRALRFCVTKGFTMAPETLAAVTSREATELLLARRDGKRVVPVERVQQELEPMFRFDSLATMRLLASLPEFLQDALLSDGLRLSATLKAAD